MAAAGEEGIIVTDQAVGRGADTAGAVAAADVDVPHTLAHTTIKRKDTIPEAANCNVNNVRKTPLNGYEDQRSLFSFCKESRLIDFSISARISSHCL